MLILLVIGHPGYLMMELKKKLIEKVKQGSRVTVLSSIQPESCSDLIEGGISFINNASRDYSLCFRITFKGIF